MKLEHTIPIGAGLGSSATFNVLISGTLYCVFQQIIQSEGQQLPNELNIESSDLKIINENLADFGERLIHGNPSGIDSYLVTMGAAVKYVK